MDFKWIFKWMEFIFMNLITTHLIVTALTIRYVRENKDRSVRRKKKLLSIDELNAASHA